MFGFGKQPSRVVAKPSLPLPAIPRLTPEKLRTIGRFRKRVVDANIPGKIWNGSNTLLGLQLGTRGYVAGAIMGKKPGIRVGGNAIQFTNNPVGGVSAVTVGNTIIWNGDPYDSVKSTGGHWFADDGSPLLEGAHTQWDHEAQHTRQGELLGPFYLPSNIAGGLYALIRDKAWHGESNWNEVGPQSDPPRPWAGPQP